jgi:hypothetical protein
MAVQEGENLSSSSVWNGVCGGGKQGFSRLFQKERLLSNPQGLLCE